MFIAEHVLCFNRNLKTRYGRVINGPGNFVPENTTYSSHDWKLHPVSLLQNDVMLPDNPIKKLCFIVTRFLLLL